MAFWGTQVKPGKPVTYSSGTGRLRISQATLGIGGITKKSVVQCNVGNRSPVFLCALLPNITESCHLDLEFEEADDVVFSVIGPRSVYLTGYYVNQSRHFNQQSDTESFGVDIEHSEPEGSNHGSDDDKYEDSFIDDDDELGVLSPSPVLVSDEIEETKLENEKSKGKNETLKRLKKRYQIRESDEDADDLHVSESEDEDGYLLSVFTKKRAAQKHTSEDEEKNGQGTVETSDKLENQSNEKANAVDVNGEPESAKPKGKRKERSEEEMKPIDEENVDLEEGKEQQEAVVKSDKMDTDIQSSQVAGDGSSENCHKSKKPKKGLGLEGSHVEGEGENTCNADEFEQDITNTVGLSKDFQATNGEHQEPTIHKDADINSHVVSDGSLPEKKHEEKKKKKKRNNKSQKDHKSDIDTTQMNADEVNTVTNLNGDAASTTLKRTLSSGLIIEEITQGEPGGKIAASGKKVKLYYTGMLRESGQIFDSNHGKRPFKFRLGDVDIIDGWNIGIDGMRVGDKRRLVIPPSMGYGNVAVGENIPPNSWLVYEVELVAVRK